MAKLMQGLVVLLIGLLSLIAIYISYVNLKPDEYSPAATQFINLSVTQISKWEPRAVQGYMSPTAWVANRDELKERLAWYSKLGALESIETPEYIHHASITSVDGKVQDIATFTADVHYQFGQATITLGLLEVGSRFQIHQFYLSSNALTQ